MIGVVIGLFSGIFIFLLAAFVSVPNHNAPGRSVPPFDPRCGKTAPDISWCPRVHVASRPANFNSQWSRWSS